VSGPADDVSGGERRAPSDVDGLLEVAGRLWPAPATVQLVRNARQPARMARDWLILPSLGKPWLLLPAWSATAADALLRDDHGQRSPQIVHALAVLHRQRMLAQQAMANRNHRTCGRWRKMSRLMPRYARMPL